jgi:hypothetical protein
VPAQRTIDGGARFLWIERPAAVREAFADISVRLH